MKRRLLVAFIVSILIIFFMACANAAYIPMPSPHKVADKPVKYTAYQSYLAGDGTVTLRKYIKQPTLHYSNPFVGKKIKSIRKIGASEEQNYWIQAALIQCGSLDAIFLIEAESGWRVDVTGFTGDKGLWQWSPIWNNKVIRNKDFSKWSYQVKTGCEKFRSLADVNEVRYSRKWKDWRSAEGGYWHGMANAYSPNVLNQFEVITE